MKIFLIILVALLITGAVFFFAFLPKIKRRKLAEAIVEQAKKLGSHATYDQVRAGIDKLSNSEVDTLITFAKHLQNTELLQAAKMFAEINPILKKADLVDILTLSA